MVRSRARVHLCALGPDARGGRGWGCGCLRGPCLRRCFAGCGAPHTPAGQTPAPPTPAPTVTPPRPHPSPQTSPTPSPRTQSTSLRPKSGRIPTNATIFPPHPTPARQTPTTPLHLTVSQIPPPHPTPPHRHTAPPYPERVLERACADDRNLSAQMSPSLGTFLFSLKLP